MAAELDIPVQGAGMPNRLVLPSELQTTEPNLRAPFIFQASTDGDEYVRSTVVGHPYYRLPDLPLTPIDEATGLPWCFAPNPYLPPAPKPNEPNYDRSAEWNHQFPKVEVIYGGNPVLEGLGRMALLNLRHQWVGFNDHHIGYNPNFIGPLQPATTSRFAATIVMGLAGYVPEFSLDFSVSKPRERRLTPEERRFLWESGQLKVACESEVVHYLFDYVFQQDVDHIRETEMDEFLHTFDLQRRIFLGHTLAAKIIERAVEPFNGVYATAHKQGLLQLRGPRSSCVRPPTHPRDLVKGMITSGRRFGKVYSELHKKLGSANRVRKMDQCMASEPCNIG